MFETPDDRAAVEKMYEGYRLAEASEFYNDVNGGYYMELRLYKKSAPKKGGKNHAKRL